VFLRHQSLPLLFTNEDPSKSNREFFSGEDIDGEAEMWMLNFFGCNNLHGFVRVVKNDYVALASPLSTPSTCIC
jgi:hypothetical protein